jgi:hypothetical protein
MVAVVDRRDMHRVLAVRKLRKVEFKSYAPVRQPLRPDGIFKLSRDDDEPGGLIPVLRIGVAYEIRLTS